MSDNENRELAEVDEQSTTGAEPEGEEEVQRLALEVKVDKRSTCQRHVTVTIPPAKTCSGTSTRNSPS